jgi:hypothetical protein
VRASQNRSTSYCVSQSTSKKIASLNVKFDPRPHDRSVRQVVEFFLSRDEAEETLEAILGDEPEWASILEIVSLELGDAALN